ncbi:hypothetical protein MNBD_ALPHA08-1100 [hydrothermal vent metagenome]|uniref:Uncharacterized protein n=1 Tax=hydrothermal vent metagenome TaxID=652676 RepID=A0A3B0S037_9ZZZZ
MPKNPDENFQRFPVKGGFGGPGKDSSGQTTILTIAAIVNWILFFYVFSELGGIGDDGKFQLSTQAPPMKFYILAAVTFVSCLGSAFLIRSDDSTYDWTARFFASGLPAAITGYLVYFTMQ